MAMRATLINIFIIHTFTSNWTTFSIDVKTSNNKRYFAVQLKSSSYIVCYSLRHLSDLQLVMTNILLLANIIFFCIFGVGYIALAYFVIVPKKNCVYMYSIICWFNSYAKNNDQKSKSLSRFRSDHMLDQFYALTYKNAGS